MASAPPGSRPAPLASAQELSRREAVIGGASEVAKNRQVNASLNDFNNKANAYAKQNNITPAAARTKLAQEELSSLKITPPEDPPYVRPEDKPNNNVISRAPSPNDETNVGPTASAPTTGAAPSTNPTKSTAASPNEEASPKIEKGVNQESRISTQGSASTQVFDINSFRSEIINNDVLPAHSYLVTFAPFRTGFPENAPLTDFVTNKRNTLVMRCESVILPTPSLLEEENIRRYGYGPVEKIPYGVQFSDVAMTWLVDKKAEIVDFMHQWMNTIVSHDSPNANMLQTADFRNGLDGYSPFEVGYKDGYANPIVRIYVYDRTNLTVTEYELFDVFPMNIQSMNLGWADENQIQKLTVNFAYTNMRVKAPQKTTAAQANFMMEGMSNPYEERKQPSNKGGKAAADRADSPVDELIVTSVNASNPFSYESKPQTLNLGIPATLTLTTRELTS